MTGPFRTRLRIEHLEDRVVLTGDLDIRPDAGVPDAFRALATGPFVIEYANSIVRSSVHPNEFYTFDDIASQGRSYWNGYLADGTENNFRTYDDTGASATLTELAGVPESPSWIRNALEVTVEGGDSWFGFAIPKGDWVLLGGAIDLGSPFKPGSGTAGTWWVPDRIGPFDFRVYSKVHDWLFNPQSVLSPRGLIDIVRTELSAYVASVGANPAMAPLQTIYSSATFSVGMLTGLTKDFVNLLSGQLPSVTPPDPNRDLAQGTGEPDTIPVDYNPNRRLVIQSFGSEDTLDLRDYILHNPDGTAGRVSSPIQVGADVVIKLGADQEIVLAGRALSDIQLGQIRTDTAGVSVRIGSRINNLGQQVATRTETYAVDGESVVSLSWDNVRENGVPIGDPRLELKWNGEIVDAGRLGSLFGSQLGSLLVGDRGVLSRIGVTALGATVVGNALKLADNLGHSFLGSSINRPARYATDLDFILDKSLQDVRSDFVANLKAESLSTLSNLLVASAAERLGLSGFAGQVFTTTGSTIANQLLTNLARPGVTNLLAGLNTAQMVTSIGTALGSLIGSKVAGQFIDPDSVGQSLLAAVGGNYLGLTYGASIGSALGSAFGVGTTALPWTLVSQMTVSEILGSILLPGVGTILGVFIGQAVGAEIYQFLDRVTGGFFTNLFSPSVWEYQYIDYNTASGQFYTSEALDHSKNTDANLRAGTHSITNAILSGVNAIVKSIGGQVDVNSTRNTAWVEWVGRNKPWGNADYTLAYNVAGQTVRTPAAGNPEKLVRDGIEFDLSQLDFLNGDPVKRRAFAAWKQSVTNPGSGDWLAALAADLQVADDYNRYLDNTATINALIAAVPDSGFAIGWLSTLMQAEALGLNRPYVIPVTNTNATGPGSLGQAMSDAGRLGLANIEFKFTAPAVDRATADAAIYRYSLEIQNVGPSAALFRNIGDLYQAEGNFPAAIYAYTRALALDPSQAVYYVQIAELYRLGNDLRSAVYAYNQALGLDPTLKPVWIRLAAAEAQLASLSSGTQKVADLTELAYAYNRLLSFDPGATTVWVSLASAQGQLAALTAGAERLGHLQSAAYADLRALQLDPSRADVKADLDATERQLANLLVWSGTQPVATVAQVANRIAGLQLPTGAILSTDSPAGYDAAGNKYFLADVYFSGTALYWALEALPVAGLDLLAVTKRWLEWCFNSADSRGMLMRYYYYADGTVARPPIPPDAQDSNSALICAVLGKFLAKGGDASFLQTPERRAIFASIAHVMLDLQQPDGLTWASQDYRVAYTEDNAEVVAGSRGAAYVLEHAFGDMAQARVYAAAAERVRTGILTRLYDTTGNGLFDWALNTPSDLAKDWYPDTITQVWPILYGVIDPASPVAQSVLAKLNAAWSGNADALRNWQDRADSASVALAYWLAGNRLAARTALLTVAQAPYPVNGYPVYITTVADSGIALALLSLVDADRTRTGSSGTSSLPFADDFDRPDAGSLGDIWVAREGNPRVSLGSALAAGAPAAVATLAGVTRRDTVAQATVSLSPGGGTASGSLVVRDHGPASAPDAYVGGVVRENGVVTARLVRLVGGTPTPLARSAALPLATQYLIRFEVVNDSLKLFVNGSLAVFSYDTTIAAAGSIGFRLTGGGRADDFSATGLSLASTVPFLAAGTSVATDTFTAANGLQLSRDWRDRVGNLRVTGNAAVGQVAGSNLSTYNIVPPTANAGAQADVTVAAANQAAGVVLRYAGVPGAADANYYLGQLRNTGSGTVAQIYRNRNGAFTLLGEVGVAGSGGTLRFEANGASLKLFLNGVRVLTAYDAILTATGGVGLRSNQGGVADNFLAFALGTNAALPFADNFDAAPLNQLGSPWRERVGAFTLAGNSARALNPGANLATLNGGAVDVVVSGVVQAQVGTTLTANQLVARYQANGDCYLGMLNAYNNSTGTFYLAEIWKVVGGVPTPLNTNVGAIVPASAVGQTMRFEVLGASLRLYLNDTLKAFAQDTSIAAAGSVGMRMGQGAGLDNFAADVRPITPAVLPSADNFNTPNAQGSLSTNWQERSGFFNVTAGNPRAVGGSASLPNVATLSGVNAANATIDANFFFTAAGQTAGLVGRYSGTNGTGDGNMYFAAFTAQANGDALVRVLKNVNGTWTQLATTTLVRYFPAATFTGTNPAFRFVLNGTQLSVFVDGLQRLTVRDTSLTTGSVGIRAGQGAGIGEFHAGA